MGNSGGRLLDASQTVGEAGLNAGDTLQLALRIGANAQPQLGGDWSLLEALGEDLLCHVLDSLPSLQDRIAVTLCSRCAP
eukprot:SAG11_NODE_1268_length_5342_cov_1.710853_7_plen_80_part_00